MSPFQADTRRAGVLIPLFSMPSSQSWGMGEIPDIVMMSRWLEAAEQRILQLLPINELPLHETSPYSAMSAMAIDPCYIALAELEDFVALGGERALEPDLRARLDSVRVAPKVHYQAIRQLKEPALRRSFSRFRDTELAGQTLRAMAFDLFVTQEAWWLDDYALFRALHAHYGEQAWSTWPEPIRTRDDRALENARKELAGEILYRQYLQWIASEQWLVARAGANARGVALFGDLPFMVSLDSADVWSRQDEFRLDASIGVPPDAFSATGQDWQLPVYRWDVLARRNFDWLRARARRNADLFGGYRVDHLVGFYRTYFRPHDGGAPQFIPADEPEQIVQGERVLTAFLESGAEIVAEDLGVVPDFVRKSLVRMAVPGCKVLRWERHWSSPGRPFIDPVGYPAVSVATSGTHDTEPMAIWLDSASFEERLAICEIPFVRDRLTDEDRARALDGRDVASSLQQPLLEALFASGSAVLILPIQDIFGWRDRINQPAVVNDQNWTWRFKWLVDRLNVQPEAIVVNNKLREWSRRHGRR